MQRGGQPSRPWLLQQRSTSDTWIHPPVGRPDQPTPYCNQASPCRDPVRRRRSCCPSRQCITGRRRGADQPLERCRVVTGVPGAHWSPLAADWERFRRTSHEPRATSHEPRATREGGRMGNGGRRRRRRPAEGWTGRNRYWCANEEQQHGRRQIISRSSIWVGSSPTRP